MGQRNFLKKKITRNMTMGKEGIELSLLADNVVIYQEYLRKSMMQIIKTFSKIVE